MKILFYSTKQFESKYLKAANTKNFDVTFIKKPLSLKTVSAAKGFDIISVSTADDASEQVLAGLKRAGVKYIASRSAGFDNIDIKKANKLNITVANVPEYSPNSIAEHAMAMILALNRKLILADREVKAHNFTLNNLVGFDLNNKTVGIIGTGRIGRIMAKILYGFGCNILAYDINYDADLQRDFNVIYTSLKKLVTSSDIITIHTPLTSQTHYLINKELILKMKPGVMLINTARGAIIDTSVLLKYIKSGHIGFFGMDVYEHERGVFFFDLSKKTFTDPILNKLMSFPNVLITPHQAFATKEALTNIAAATFYNIDCWIHNTSSQNELI